MDETTGGLDLEETLDDFITMYAAGNVTTKTTFLWSLGQLTRNPDVMVKLVEEVLLLIEANLTYLFKFEIEFGLKTSRKAPK